jgi:hypothetical protein
MLLELMGGVHLDKIFLKRKPDININIILAYGARVWQ